MPFKSCEQMRWMFANKPAMAKKWADTYGIPSKCKKRKKKEKK